MLLEEGVLLESVSIKNYQKHKRLRMTFKEGLNVIVGETDRGKSSALRAILWVLTNKPKGKSFINWEEKKKRASQVKVSIKMDGELLQRNKKGSSENSYRLGNKKFKASGQEIPKEVDEFINISEEVNIQKQLDAPFLLSETAGEVGRKLNKVVNLEKIDSSLKNIAHVLSKERRDLEYARGYLDETEKELAEYEWLPEARDRLNRLEKRRRDLNTLRGNFSNLKGLVESIKDIRERADEFNYVVKFRKWVDSLCKRRNSLIEKKKRYYDLYDLIGGIERTVSGVKKLENELDEARKKFNKLMPDICPLCGK